MLSTGDSPHHVLIASLALLMALLVAQTRVEAGVHSVSEVVLGGVLGLARHAARVPARALTHFRHGPCERACTRRAPSLEL